MVERGAASVRHRPARREILRWAWALVATITLAVLLWLPRWTAVPPGWFDPQPPPIAPADRLVLEPSSYVALPGFDQDPLVEALPALRRSCLRFRFLGPAHEILPTAQGGTVADWLPFCDAI